MPNGEGLPPDIIEAIAVSNAKSIGEQPAILANLALANQIANTNLSQQNAISNQQAMFQLQMATLSKCVEVILGTDASSTQAMRQMKEFQEFFSQIMEQLGALSNGAQQQQATRGAANGARRTGGKKNPRRR